MAIRVNSAPPNSPPAAAPDGTAPATGSPPGAVETPRAAPAATTPTASDPPAPSPPGAEPAPDPAAVERARAIHRSQEQQVRLRVQGLARPPAALTELLPRLATGTSVQGSVRLSAGQGRATEMQITAQRAPARLQESSSGAGPDSMVQLEVSGRLASRDSARAVAGQVAVTESGQTGNALQYLVQVPEAAFNRIRQGQQPFPDPRDPTTLPVGGRVALRQSDFSGRQLSGSYRGVTATIGAAEVAGAGLGAQRLDEQTVRVTAGPLEAVQRTLGLGLEVGVARIGVGRQDSAAATELRSADLDLGTPGGRQAYEDFLRTGAVPANDPPAVRNGARVQLLDLNSASGVQLGVSAGGIGLQVAAELRSAQGQRAVTSYDDGRRSERLTYRFDRSTLTTTREYAAGADAPHGERTSVLMDGVPAASARYAQHLFTGQEPTDLRGAQDIQLGFTGEQVRQIQDRVRRFVDAGAPADRAARSADPILASILRATDPTSFAAALVREPSGGLRFLDRLHEVAMDTSPASGFAPMAATLAMTPDAR